MEINILIALIIGIIAGVVMTRLYIHVTCSIVGTLKIDASDKDRDIYTLMLEVPVEELPKHKMIRFKVSAYKTAPNMKN